MSKRPDTETILGRARALVPTLRERAQASSRAGRLPAETVQAMHEAGLFRVLQPKRWGGYEMHPNVFYDVIQILGEGDMSVAWCYGVLACHAWQLALFDDRAAEEVWSRDDSALISSSYMLTGKGVPVAGGYRFSGRWRFSSGSEHAQHAFLGGLADPESGKMDARTFLLPRSDYTIVPTWDTIGLRGTGSQDIVVEDAFVPDYRTHRIADGTRCRSPGNEVNTGALYRIAFAQIFVRAVSTPALGGLTGMLDEFLDYGRVRQSAATRAKTVEDPVALLTCAEVDAALDEMRLVLRSSMDRLMAQAEANEATPVRDRLRNRVQSAEVPDRCARLAQKLFMAAGGSAAYEELPFARRLADLTVARQHAANQFEAIGRNYGGTLLDKPNAEGFY